MTNVVIDRMICREESDELGDDDLYLLTFRGDLPKAGGLESTTDFSVRTWNDVGTGDVRGSDVPIAKFTPRSIYVSQLIERDNGRDVKGSVESAYRSALDIAWAGALARTIGMSDGERRPKLVRTIQQALRGLNTIYMEFPKGNDDWIGQPKQLLPQVGKLSSLDFNGDGGRYRLDIKVA